MDLNAEEHFRIVNLHKLAKATVSPFGGWFFPCFFLCLSAKQVVPWTSLTTESFLRMLRPCIIAIVCLLLDAGFSCGDDLPGIVQGKPTDGFAVETEQGWMIPYDVTIPGTQIVFRMLPIPGGHFVMGSSAAEAGRRDDESPQRKVIVAPFWMSECEVKWEEYKLFMQLYRSLKEFEERRIRTVTDENKIDAITAPTPLYEPDFTFEYGEDPQHPAVSMTQ